MSATVNAVSGVNVMQYNPQRLLSHLARNPKFLMEVAKTTQSFELRRAFIDHGVRAWAPESLLQNPHITSPELNTIAEKLLRSRILRDDATDPAVEFKLLRLLLKHEKTPENTKRAITAALEDKTNFTPQPVLIRTTSTATG